MSRPVFSEHARPEVRLVCGGTLDDPSHITPDVHIYTRSNVGWVTLEDETQAFEVYYDTDRLWLADSLPRLQSIRRHPSRWGPQQKVADVHLGRSAGSRSQRRL